MDFSEISLANAIGQVLSIGFIVVSAYGLLWGMRRVIGLISNEFYEYSDDGFTSDDFDTEWRDRVFQAEKCGVYIEYDDEYREGEKPWHDLSEQEFQERLNERVNENILNESANENSNNQYSDNWGNPISKEDWEIMKQDEQESKDTNGGLVYDEYTGHWVDPSDAFNDEDYK